jgi:hypothetical protein
MSFDVDRESAVAPDWGKNDQFACETMARESLRWCDEGYLEMFETATHWVQHERTAQVNKLLSQFFA